MCDEGRLSPEENEREAMFAANGEVCCGGIGGTGGWFAIGPAGSVSAWVNRISGSSGISSALVK
jgi:hypothetical protein